MSEQNGHANAQNMNVIFGSRDLLRAILETGRLYRQMTAEEMDAAVLYAYGSTKRLIR